MTPKSPAKGYVEAWDVESLTDSSKVYTVSKRRNGTYACSCPNWKFARSPKPDCKHICSIVVSLQRPAAVLPVAVAVPLASIAVSMDGVFVGRVSQTVALQIRALVGVASKPLPEITTVGEFRITRKFKES